MSRKKYFTYKQARSFCRKNVPKEIKTIPSLNKWLTKNKDIIPKQMPLRPHAYYNFRKIKGKGYWNGWNGLADFLGRHTRRFTHKYKIDDESINTRKRLIIDKIKSKINEKKDWCYLLTYYTTPNFGKDDIINYINKGIELNNKQSEIRKLVYYRLMKNEYFNPKELVEQDYQDLWIESLIKYMEAVDFCKLNYHIIDNTSFYKWSINVISRNIVYSYISLKNSENFKGAKAKPLLCAGRLLTDKLN